MRKFYVTFSFVDAEGKLDITYEYITLGEHEKATYTTFVEKLVDMCGGKWFDLIIAWSLAEE
jgi:hypothetical protein